MCIRDRIWLNEGLASVAELYPNPDYLILLDEAHKKDKLIPLINLCDTFPREASDTFLAYAEAASFTQFLFQHQGSEGVQSLIRQYSSGENCQQGIQSAFGGNLEQFEFQWRQETFGEVSPITALENFSPWLMLLTLAIIFPIILAISISAKG